MIQSPSQRVLSDASLRRPVGYAESFAMKSKHAIVARVASLLFASDPAAVLWAVSVIVVAPVKFMLGRRSRSHVGQEAYETISVAPSITDEDSATAVVCKGRVVGVQATLLHAGPCFPLRGAFHAVLAFHAPAACSPRALHVVRSQCPFGSAVASAFPEGSLPDGVRELHDRPSSVANSGQVFAIAA